MNIKRIFFTIALCSIFSFVAGHSSVFAASTPILSLSASGSSVTVTINGADPAAAVVLYYTSATSSYASLGLGLTDSTGHLSTSLSNSTGVVTGSSVYVIVDGASSATQNWPGSSTVGNLSLSQNVLNMSTNQSASVIVNGASGSITITQNSNQSAAIGSVFGNTVVVTAGANNGITTLTICDSTNSCQNLSVSVITGLPFSLASTAANLTIGQTQNIAISGLGPFTISQNTNPSAVSAAINGSNLVLTGVGSGSASINVCQSGSSCSIINVASNPANGSSAPVTSAGSVVFSQNPVNISIGETQTISVSGGGGTGQYYPSGSAPGVATLRLNGNVLTVTGLSAGSATAGVCAYSGQCGTLTITVGSGSQASSAQTQAPMLSSVTMSTNGSGGSFADTGSTLSFTFNVNQSVSSFRVTIGGAQAVVNGSGSGPYTASYQIGSNTVQPIPVAVSFSNSSGASGQSSFSIGAPAIRSAPASSAATQTSVAQTFTQYLHAGMTALGVSNSEVAALQQRLKSEGFFNAAITGYFGSQTKAALSAFQKKHGLDPLGVVGPSTRALLNKGI